MKFIRLFLFFIALLSAVSFTSCSSKHKRHFNTSDTSFVKGKVTEGVKCSYDYTNTYAVYLPSNYDKSKQWPVVYMFDPHGKGSLPLFKYNSIAEKFGYILIGSNNSKNGMAMNSVKAVFDTLYSDSHRKFSIDDKQVYAAGFSGGSRVASYLASYGKIKTVIACGAGMSSADANSASTFGYFGIVGNEDFNLTEMLAVKDFLDKTSKAHCFKVYSGKHAWPPESLFEEAFLWIDLQAMKNKIKTIDLAFANPYFDSWKTQFEELKLSDPYNAYLMAEKIISFYDGLKDVSAFQSALDELKKNATVISAIENQKTYFEKEAVLQKEYSSAMNEKDTSWWKQQVILMKIQTKSVSDPTAAQMYKRIMNYLSLVAYMNASSKIKAYDYAGADKYVKIYSLVDPENPEHAYLRATLQMKNNDIESALLSLETAAGLGFSESYRLESDTVMNRLRTQKKYESILDTIKNNTNKNE